jgi:hypothetical protein
MLGGSSVDHGKENRRLLAKTRSLETPLVAARDTRLTSSDSEDCRLNLSPSPPIWLVTTHITDPR